MGITVDGNDIVFDGTIRIVNGFNPETGVAYMILTPSGGTATLPFLAQGESGLSPVFDSISVVEVDPANDLPSPNPVTTIVSPGGPGVAAHYTLTFYIHSGAKGATGANEISTATDLATTPALGSSTNAYILVYDATNEVWVPTSQKVGDVYIPTAIAATSFNASSPRTIATVAVPGQPFNWRPRCFAQTIVTGSSDTRVDLYARINSASSSADQVGYSKGVAGAAPPPNILIPAPPIGADLRNGYGKVLAGNPATIYLVAEQKAASSSSWSTPGAPDTTFQVEVAPIL